MYGSLAAKGLNALESRPLFDAPTKPVLRLNCPYRRQAKKLRLNPIIPHLKTVITSNVSSYLSKIFK